ncbi:CHAT domain-containing protein [Algoriphagus halophytocola]|uniref:CHAT domain-containing protein n=1 Tax=Algoriphagus halophytocola TaxID=2991499 RepID=A0ABY6MI43_9BACT|nr:MULTISPECIES: CHAT domain-containing tetratricopeptide repeat protein [unclassified Algoriphagus]UZD22873.1 CHAT domain-containing protein [Algoriphagus sp. TR-M5]WBL44140.1 CHAT domain-containing protein [Algoriphagus sp. TR-M9]
MLRFFFLPILFFASAVWGQTIDRKASWEKMLETGTHSTALAEVKEFTQSLIDQKLYDSLPEYLEIYGRILQANFAEKESDQKLQETYQNWENLSEEATFRRRLAKSLAHWYEYTGNTTAAYQQTLVALDWAKKEKPKSQEAFSNIYLNLGGLAIKNMDLPAAKKHLDEVLSLDLSQTDPENVYFANSYLGNISYYNSNLDSAAFYYQKSIEAIDQLEPTPRNQFYRKSIILNNLAGVQMAQSDFDAAEQSMNLTISYQEKYLAADLEELEKQKVLQAYFRSMDNLAGLYRQLGSYHRAKQLLEFSFQRKSEEFGNQDLETAKSRILLGQVYFDMIQIEQSREFLLEGLKQMQELEEESSYWQADAINTLARMEDYLQNEEQADSLYRKAKTIFDQEVQGDYDVIYLDFLKNFSKFLAENKKMDEAIQLSTLARNYLADVGSENLYLDYNQTINQASIYELGQNYQKALQYTSDALSQIDLLMARSKSPKDSIQAMFLKSQPILIRNRSRYYLEKVDESLLKSIEKELREGLKIIDSQSDFLFEPSDVSIQLDVNREYFEFLELIELELYQLSGEEIYLDRLLAYHEHARYRKIRSRLQKNQQVHFGGLPAEILNREEELKEQLRQSLQAEVTDLSAYAKANSEWTAFLDTLKVNYPNYYQLHFETSESVLARVFSKLDPEISYLRYLNIGQEWWLMTIRDNEKKLIALSSDALTEALEKLAEQSSQNKIQPALLHELYNLIWEPSEPFISTQRIAIIPEGLLFNLSFETLTKAPIQDWTELTDHFLLSDHSFSYQYSLLFLEDQAASVYEDQLIAFAPGFFDGMKQSYSASFLDQQFLDLDYLKLLPQPFTRRLVEDISSKFEAKTYLENGSTLKNFRVEAGQTRIIHIGTHAISSNVNPGDSRLVFAKSTENPIEPNELFASEIYGLDLSAELAVLLACESGKPSYSPGEGMISLAHAFNYSGTKSLLMGLWKIDEQTSVNIAAEFYDFLEDGLPKDEALRKAKLNYLAKAKGRALDPSFWSGLILLGNPEPVALETKQSPWPLYAALLLALVFLAWFFKKKFYSN